MWCVCFISILSNSLTLLFPCSVDTKSQNEIAFSFRNFHHESDRNVELCKIERKKTHTHTHSNIEIVHSLYTSRAVRIHFARPEYYTHGDIFNVSYILLFYGCLFLLLLYSVLWTASFFMSHFHSFAVSFVFYSFYLLFLCRHIHILCSKCHIEAVRPTKTKL